MKDFVRLLSYLRPYKRYVGLNILSNIMMALFMVVSIPAIIPFFKILFDRTPRVTEPVELSFSTLEAWANYRFSLFLETHTKEEALAWICAAFVVIFFFQEDLPQFAFLDQVFYLSSDYALIFSIINVLKN